jgi:Tol biopolymer transport system component
MTVTAPPRPPRPSDPVDREELEALVEALIEEARQRARRRRRIYAASAALVALVVVAVSAAVDRSTQPDTASPALAARSGVPAATTSSKIAFISIPVRGGTQGPGGLFVVNADGSGKRQLTRAKYATPTWSPDGRKIAFVRSGHVYVMNTDGSGEQNLTNSPTGAAAPAWSPDGRRIAFLRAGPATAWGWDVYVMDADGRGPRRLAGNAWLAAPAWSPDGRRIAFVSERDGNAEVHVMNADGSRQRKLTRNPARDLAPAWSPDGRRIAFERRLGRKKYGPCSGCGRASTFEVHVINADGSGQRRLTRTGAQPLWKTGAQPVWSPDGRRIAFVRNSERDGNAEVYVMNADGSRQRKLTRTWEDDCCLAWSPAQK